MKNILKLLINFILKLINSFLYPKYDVKNSVHSQIVILKLGFFQKILGFNRKTPWPVHRTSLLKAVDKIKPGTRTPGLAQNCYIDGRNGIIIEENVWIGPNVSLISQNHDINNYNKYLKDSPIKIGKNTWIAANSTILAGVELGEHTIVAAGSVVTKSFPNSNQIIAGNPAKIIKQIGEYTNE